MAVDVNILKSISIFDDICSSNLHKLSSLIYPVKVSEEEVLIRKKNPAHSLYIIMSGNFMVSFKDGRGYTLHDRGDIIGWSSFITPFKYKGTSVALTDGEVLSIHSRKLQGLIQENAELATQFLEKINSIILDRLQFIYANPLSRHEVASEPSA
ncbi:MAG: cyclic nucleotide-binding domain-containing protein [Desulfobacterales bacterium]|nr:cyclic nucleotide-binding domain-containing protein [Desulfobacterales bacterium]MDD4071699.1 cyclic nucleotide-binding domain-containing protein [Desulfobacterales bacterium]MDD4391397.1 cyclic nucleotide-binding domain-containing protein [Desulfobacterales bacterium]